MAASRTGSSSSASSTPGCGRSPRTHARPGDVVLLAWRRLMPAHAAILGDGPNGLSLIHADGQVGRVVEHRLDREWWGRIVCAYRLAELP